MKVRRSTFARLRVGIDTAVLLAAVVGFTAFGVLIVHGVYMGWLIQLMLIITGTRAVGHVFGLADVWFSQIDGNEQQDFTKGDQDDR